MSEQDPELQAFAKFIGAIEPWLDGKENGYSFSRKLKVQIANPTSFLAQKILIHEEREPRDRAKDLLYIHDTIEVFSENLGELQKIFGQEIAPRLHPRKRAKVEGAVESLFGKVADTIREAAVMAVGRNLSADRLAEASHLAPLGRCEFVYFVVW